MTSNYQRSIQKTVSASQTSLLAPSTSSTYLSKQTSNDSLDQWNAGLNESLTDAGLEDTNDEVLSAVHSMAACSSSSSVSTKSLTSDNISASTLKTSAANITFQKQTPSADISKKRKRGTIDEVDKVMLESSQNISSLASTLEAALKTPALKQQLTSECTPAVQGMLPSITLGLNKVPEEHQMWIVLYLFFPALIHLVEKTKN